MDGGELTLLGQSENFIGSGMELENRVDDSNLVGDAGGGGGVVEEVEEVKGKEEEEVEMALVTNLESRLLPAVVEAPDVVEEVMITPVVVAVEKEEEDNQMMMDRKKRGRPGRSYVTNKVPAHPRRKMIREEEEDVCFICFDGGSLVLCDRKGCPKAYHPACIKRDEKFFTAKTRWDCGWHICSVCEKPSLHFCYTCTYSLCKKCTKNSEYVSIRGNRGFCPICMKIIMMIENKDTENKESIQVDFDDKTSWEYLFKVYWIVLKTKWSLTLNELLEAKNPYKGVLGTKLKPQLREKNIAAVGGALQHILPKSVENSEQKSLPEQNQVPDQDSVSSEKRSSEKRKISDGCMDWASQELLEFVAHMRNGDTSVLSQFDVQALLQEYIKVNNLRNPLQKSQIICDSRLKTLFGKPRVGHIEMLKLLEYHYLIADDTEKNAAVIPAGIVESGSHVAIDNSNYNHSVSIQSKKQKTRKKGEEKVSQVNLHEYAAVDNHNVKLIFLRRSMLENLLDQVNKFHDKVVGSIVRIRVSANDQKQDIYRLVQVVGTSKGSESYKIGDKTTDILLEVLNLDKKETMSIISISNQDFSEEECRRLRQSIKWGLVKRMTVGEIQTKAMALQTLRFDDWLVAEILRLSHLRDRANEKGHKKELRECVEKLQVLKTPEERQRKLNEIPEVHADPKMNPNYESEEDTRDKDKKRDGVLRRGHSNLSMTGNQLRPKKSVKDEDNNVQRVEKKSNGGGASCFQHQENHASSFGNSPSICSNQSLVRSNSERAITPPVSQTSSLAINIQAEKIWYYRDPNGKIQGPFSMVQLQKWSTTGYFPVNMSIWTTNEQNYSIFLNDALSGQFHKNIELYHSIFSEPRVTAGIVTHPSICVGDSLKNLCSDTRNDNATGQVGLDSCTFDRIAEPIYNEKQSVSQPCSDLPKNVTAEISDADKTEHVSIAPQHYSPVSSGQNRPPVLNLDLNSGDCNIVASVTNTSVSSAGKVDLDVVELPSPTPKYETKDLKSQPNAQESVFMDIQAAEMLRSLSGHVPSTNGMTVSDVRASTPNPTDEDPPKPNPVDVENIPNPEPTELTDENHLGQSSGPAEVSLKDLGWTISISGQDSAEPSCKEWDFGLVPMLKSSDAADALDSNASRHLDVNLPFHPLPNMSSWPHEPIEFSTLAEESVSDLLAEVDAMESQIGMPPSPSSAMRCADGNDCFSSIEELSPNTDASKSDAVSFPSQQPEIDEHSVVASHIDGFDPVKRTDLQPSTSTEVEVKSGNFPINIWENRSDNIHPPMNQAMINAAGHNWASVQGNMNMGWAGPPPPPQAFPDVGWRPPLNTTWANPNLSLGSFNGNPGWDNNPHRFNGSRDWQFQGGGGDLGFGRGGGGGGGGVRPMWGGRQQYNGGGSGGGSFSRPMPKGSRVCKFYESGHCKKGASCGYLHP